MSNVKKIAGNAGILLTGGVTNRIFDVFSIILLTEYLDIGQFGYYRTIFAYFALWATAIDLGVQGILIREGARDRKNALAIMYNGYAIGVLLTLIVISASYFTLELLVNYPREVKDLFWYGVLSVIVSSRFKSFRKLFESLFVIDYKFIYPVVFNILDRVLFVVCLLLFIRTSHSLTHAVFITISADFIGFLLLMLAHIIRYKMPRFRFNRKRWKALISQSIPLLFSSILNTLNLKIGLLISTIYLLGSEVGIYGFALLLAESLSFIPSVISQSAYPILSQKYLKSSEVYIDTYRLLVKYLLIVIIPLVIFLTIEIQEIITLFVHIFLKEQYIHAVAPAQILLVSQIFYYGFIGYCTGLVTSNKQFYSMVLFGITAVCNVALSLTLIPKFGVMGAAYSVTVSSSIFLISGLFFQQIRTLTLVQYPLFAKLIPPAVLTWIILYFMNTKFWLTMIVCFPLFIGLLFLFRGVSAEDIRILYEVRPTRVVRWVAKKIEKSPGSQKKPRST